VKIQNEIFLYLRAFITIYSRKVKKFLRI